MTEIKTIKSAPGTIPEFNLLADEWGFVAKLGGVTISACHHGTKREAIDDWNNFCDRINLNLQDAPKRLWLCDADTTPEIYGDQIIGWQVYQHFTKELFSPVIYGKRCEDANKAINAWNELVDEMEALR